MSQLSPDQHARIKAALGKSAGQRLADTDLWPAIQQQAQTMPLPSTDAAPLYAAAAPASQPRRAVRFNLATAAISVAVLLVVGLLTYALLPAFTPPAIQGKSTPIASAPPVGNAANTSSAPGPILFSTPLTVTEPYQDPADSNLMSAAVAQRAQPLDLSETVNGYTITLQRVYADANIIVVPCSVAGPRTLRVSPAQITLTSGSDEAVSHGVNVETYSDKEGTPNDCAMEFDATTLKTAATSINLHLTFNIVYHPDISKIDFSHITPTPGVPVWQRFDQMLAGPFTFDFTAALTPDIRIVNVGQTVTTHGITFTLERLVITPGETRIIVRYTLPDSNPNIQWKPIIAVDGPDWATMGSDNYARYQYRMDIHGEGAVSQLPDGSSAYQIVGNLYDTTGPWTVTVKELYGFNQVTYNDQHDTGPWVFKFNVAGK